MTNTAAFRINGVIDTSRSVLDNLNTLCNASGCWLSFDITTGLWSVIINKAGSSVKSFTDNNIIGNINVSFTGINELYNKVSIDFPHKDLRDQRDYIDLSIAEGDRLPNELDNTLSMSFDIINDPVQAQYIAQVELKQSRQNTVIEFRTDFSSLGLRAGDIINITSEQYGYIAKKFRIIKISEEDTDTGSLELSIQAIVYDPSIYDASGLVREERTKKTGIIPKSMNSALTNSDNQATITNLTNGLNNPENALLALTLGNALKNNSNISGSQRNMHASLLATLITPPTPVLNWFTIFGNTEPSGASGYYETYHISSNFNWAATKVSGNGLFQMWKSSNIRIKINGLELLDYFLINPQGAELLTHYQDLGWTINYGSLTFGTGGGYGAVWEDHILDVMCLIPVGVSWTIEAALNYDTALSVDSVVSDVAAFVNTCITPVNLTGGI